MEGSMAVTQAMAQESKWVTEYGSDAEATLVDQIARGDRQAFVTLYESYRLPLFRYLLLMTPDRGLAEEILQDTFVALWKSADTFRARSQVRTWLFGIARRKAHNALRRHGVPLTTDADLEALPAHDAEPETALLAMADRDDLTIAMRRLSPVHREVLYLTLVQELSHAQSADILGVPVGTVKSRLSNAKRSLRALLSIEKEPNQ